MSKASVSDVTDIGDGATVDSTVNYDNVIVNELLSYMFHYQKSSDNQSLISTVFNFYTTEEVVSAKRLINKICKKADVRNRRDCKSYNGKMENVSDILKVIKEHDSAPSADVTFAAVNLKRIPGYGPEETCSLNMVNDINNIKAELKAMRNNMAEVTTDVSALKLRKVGLHERSWSNVVTQDAVLPVATLPTTRPTVTTPLPMPGTVTNLEQQHVPTVDIAQRQQQQQGFIFPKQHLRRERRRSSMSSRGKVVCGSGNVTGGMLKKMTLFVYNCNKTCTDEWLTTHMKREDSASGKVSVTPLNVWSINTKRENPLSKSFKVIIDAKHKDSVFECDFWPANVLMRLWTKDPPAPRRQRIPDEVPVNVPVSEPVTDTRIPDEVPVNAPVSEPDTDTPALDEHHD